jgi:hypothetical protein
MFNHTHRLEQRPPGKRQRNELRQGEKEFPYHKERANSILRGLCTHSYILVRANSILRGVPTRIFYSPSKGSLHCDYNCNEVTCLPLTIECNIALSLHTRHFMSVSRSGNSEISGRPIFREVKQTFMQNQRSRAREREAERQKVSGTSVNYYASKCELIMF